MDVNHTRVDLLLIEDSMDDARLIIRVLNKGPQLHIVHLKDGAEGLDYLLGGDLYDSRGMDRFPRLILLDLRMPRVNGLELLQKLKADDRTRPIPIVLLTCSNEDPDIGKAYDLGVSSYIVKCINATEFASTITKLHHYWFPTVEME
jgi:two-component system, response regulator